MSDSTIDPYLNDDVIAHEDGMIRVLFPEAADPGFRSDMRRLARKATNETQPEADGTIRCPLCRECYPGRAEFEGHALIELYRLNRKEEVNAEQLRRERQAKTRKQGDHSNL